MRHWPTGMMPLLLAALIFVPGLCAAPLDPAREGRPSAMAGESRLAARYRSERPEPRAGDVPATIKHGLNRKPDEFLPRLVNWLLDGEADDFGRVKLIHDWIALTIRYDLEAAHSGTGGGGYAEALRGGASICEGYASLFDRMCALAGIESLTIGGYGRGSPEIAFQEGSATAENHAWNAVRLAGRWYLVDTTWDAGHADEGRWTRHYTTANLFLEPQKFVYTHWPREERWQLLEPPLSREAFLELPYLTGDFFARGLELAAPLTRMSKVTDTSSFALRVPDEITVITTLRAKGGGQLKEQTLEQREGDRVSVQVLFPRAGTWSVELFARRADDPGEHLLVAAFGFAASRGSPKRFPERLQSFVERRAVLYKPLFTPLPTSHPVEFEIRVPEAQGVAVVIDGRQWNHLERLPGDLFRGRVQIPPGKSVILFAQFERGGRQWTGLVQF